MVNHSSEDIVIQDGDRKAQMVIARYERVDWKLTDKLDDTERGAGGFGHSGNK